LVITTLNVAHSLHRSVVIFLWRNPPAHWRIWQNFGWV